MSRTPSVGQQPSQPGVKPAILPPAQRGVKPASLRLVLPTTGSAGLPQLQQQQSAAAFDNRQERWECCTSHFLKIYLLILGGGGLADHLLEKCRKGKGNVEYVRTERESVKGNLSWIKRKMQAGT
jgi:hypothetical protein